MTDAVIPAKYASLALEELLSNNLVDRSLKIDRDDDFVHVPLLSPDIPNSIIQNYEIVFDGAYHRPRTTKKVPFIIIRNRLKEKGLTEMQLSLLPSKWELLGDVLILKLNEKLVRKSDKIAIEYASVLGVKSVLRDLGEISGEERLPKMELIFGSDTETLHIENGIKYSLDAGKIMFSSGNIFERIQIAKCDCRKKIVLDMFAGIGYFTLPAAIYGKPDRVYACEIRKLSYDYLLKNVNLNGVDNIVKPFLGDNRDFNLPEQADLIIMGYLKDTHKFLPKALSMLRNGGRILYHENCPSELFPERSIKHLKKAAGRNWKIDIISKRVVKSYSPGMSHIVVDAKFNES